MRESFKFLTPILISIIFKFQKNIQLEALSTFYKNYIESIYILHHKFTNNR